CELVGPLSTRSKPLQSASLPNNRIDQTDASPTSPIEWALASLDFDAARLRMIPSKIAVVFGRSLVRADVVLPRHLVPLAEFALGAAGDVDGEFLCGVGGFPERQPKQCLKDGGDRFDEGLRGDRVRNGGKRKRQRDRQIGAPQTRMQVRGGAGQVIPDA